MSKYIDYQPLHVDEIDYNRCKWLYNEVCCCADSPYVADYPIHKCKSKKDCDFFEKEDGIISKE